MKQIFLPVWGDSRHFGAARLAGVKHWWNEPPLNYGHALLSYVHWKKPFEFPKDAYIFGDSGGFSLRNPRAALRIDPLDVLKWQRSMCTVGAILDLPPFGQPKSEPTYGATYAPPGSVPITRGEELSRVRERRGQRIWKQAIERTEKFVKRALPEYQRMLDAGDPFRWWGVLHGNTHEEVCEWYERIAAIYPFNGPGEGWAIRAEPHVTILTVARSLRTLRQLGISRVHFLAATNNQITATLMALAPLAKMDFVTYDSSYATKAAMHRIAFRRNESEGNPGWTWTPIKEMTARHWNSTNKFRTREEFYASLADNHTTRDFLLACQCASCTQMRSLHSDHKEVKAKKYGGIFSLWGILHNQLVQQTVTSAQHAAAEAGLGEQMLRTVLGHSDYCRVMRVYEGEDVQAATGTETSLLSFIR